jgi:electron transfer flavoprotein alpha subunit
VCIKQVPRLDEVRFDKRNRIVREEIELVVNPLDAQALGHALNLRESEGGEVVVLTMGPPSARPVLEEAVRRGADRAVHLVDKRFAGADTLATARALARALEREQADVILFGRSTLDGATAQVGPQVAELLGIPQVTHALSVSLDGDDVRVERETERDVEIWRSNTPVAVSIERGPEPPETDETREFTVDELEAETLGGTPRDYGTRGSPTFVKEVRESSLARETERVERPQDGADRLAELLEDLDLEPGEAKSRNGQQERGLWVMAERDGDRLHPTSLEGIACAREVADQLSAEVVAVLLTHDPGQLPQDLGAAGADRVLVVRHPALEDFGTATFTAALCSALEQSAPFAVIAPWTSQGRDYVPRVAARLGLGLTGDFTRLEVTGGDGEDEDPDLLWIKPAWAGTVESPIITHRSPSIGTLRPGVFRPLQRSDDSETPVQEIEVDLDVTDGAWCEDRRAEVEQGRLLDNSPTVVCIGPGLDPDDVDAARHLADALQGGLGATHGAVANGLVPPQLEIGVLKRSMSPLLLVGLGVHDETDLDAVRAARRLVTVHPDAEAPAHSRADLAIVAEPSEFVSVALARLGADVGSQ